MNRKLWYGLTLVIVLGLVGFVVWCYPALPQNVPSHWNINGEVDAYSDPLTSSLLVPGMVVFICGLMLLIAQYEKDRRVSDALIKMSTIMAAFLATLHVIITLIALGYDLQLERYITACIGILFAVIGRLMRNIPPNGYFGIRTYWTLQNPTVWAETHVIGARWMVIAGVIACVSAVLPIPAAYLFGILFSAILLSVGIPMIYAYRRFHQLQDV